MPLCEVRRHRLAKSYVAGAVRMCSAMTSARVVVAALAVAVLAGCGNRDAEVDAGTTSTVTSAPTADRE